MDTRTAVQYRIVELCAAKRWAFNSVALYSGISPSTMKSILNGQSQNPGIVTIKKICDGLEISLADFFDTEVFRTLEQEIR